MDGLSEESAEEIMSSECSPARPNTKENVALCPRCRKKGKPVSLATVGAMAKTELEAIKLSAQEYYLCRTPDCLVVYYAEEIRIEKSELRVPVNFKEQNYDGPVCYCFNHTVASIRAEIQAKGHSTAQAMIAQEVKAGRCACVVKNPAGTCCLGDVARAVQVITGQ
ncbi:MAG TPA: hypothetical protein VNM15_02175 [Candidatus Binatia bacterium]|nr:hypothetical protein [Candidatus Binatia bacterium]